MQNVTPTVLVSPSATVLSTANPTRQPTLTIMPSLVEPTATSTVALSPEYILKYQRLDVAPRLPSDANPVGTLVLFGDRGGRSYLLKFDQQVEQEIAGRKFCFSTSPDGKWLAYCEFPVDSSTGGWLIVEGNNGQQVKKLPMGKDWNFFTATTWLGNERLVFNLLRDTGEVSPVVVVNPFTGEQTQLKSDYPGIYIDKSPGTGGGLYFVYSAVVYDPSLNLVIYPQRDVDKRSDFVVLWDRQVGKTLARVPEWGVFYHTPLWSPDVTQFVVAVTPNLKSNSNRGAIEEWFSVSREGQVRQLTHFGDFFADVRIGAANWSPDGRWLAFWLEAKPSLCEGQNLVVLEMETQSVTEYCVPGSIYGDAPPPIWSPDSRYIAVQNYYEVNSSHVILVDIMQGWATQIAENVEPAGWLVAP
jgi:Tol biopolymer transport system component